MSFELQNKLNDALAEKKAAEENAAGTSADAETAMEVCAPLDSSTLPDLDALLCWPFDDAQTNESS